MRLCQAYCVVVAAILVYLYPSPADAAPFCNVFYLTVSNVDRALRQYEDPSDTSQQRTSLWKLIQNDMTIREQLVDYDINHGGDGIKECDDEAQALGWDVKARFDIYRFSNGVSPSSDLLYEAWFDLDQLQGFLNSGSFKEPHFTILKAKLIQWYHLEHERLPN